MKFKELYEQACREVVESVASYWQGDDPTRRDDPYLGDFKQTIRKTFCPDDCYPVVQSMFPWEVQYGVAAGDRSSGCLDCHV